MGWYKYNTDLYVIHFFFDKSWECFLFKITITIFLIHARPEELYWLRNSEIWGSIMNSASKKSYFWQVHWRRGVSLPGNLTTKRKRAKQWRRITKKEKRYMKYLCQTESNSGMDGNMSPSCLTPNKRRGAEVYRVSGHAGRAWWQE